MHALFPKHSAGVRVHLGLQWGPSSLGGRSCSKGQRGWRRRLPGARQAARLCREAGCQDPEPAGFLRAPVILPFAWRRLLPPPLSAFPPAGLPVAFPSGRCPLPSSQQLGALEERGPRQAHPPPWQAPASQESVGCRCCDMMTSSQALGDNMHVTCCVWQAPTPHQSRSWLGHSEPPVSTLGSEPNLQRTEQPYCQRGRPAPCLQEHHRARSSHLHTRMGQSFLLSILQLGASQAHEFAGRFCFPRLLHFLQRCILLVLTCCI